MQRINPEWEVSVHDVQNMLSNGDNVLLVDVRQPEEFEFCKINGAHLVPLPELPRQVDKLEDMAAGRRIIAHCHHGVRSMQAAALLREAGLTQTHSMAGGIDAWSAEIDPNVPRY